MNDKVVDISEITQGYPWYENNNEADLANVDIYDGYLAHYGTPRHSGRYPWGSGENPYQRSALWRREYTKLKKQGMNEKELADYFNMSISELRSKVSNTKAEVDAYEYRQIIKMRNKGMSYQAIADALGMPNESSVRSRIASYEDKKVSQNKLVADTLAEAVKSKGLIDIGLGVSDTMGITETRLKNAVNLLKEQGYVVQSIYIPQATNPDQYTTVKVLAPPGTTSAEILKNKNEVKTIVDIHKEVDENGNESFYNFEPPKSIDSKRIFVRYSDTPDKDGFTGEDRDGLIELRRGVEDISLGNSLYKQVRIGVDDTNYMKGMAVYSDNIPEGYDVVYNTNKKKGTDLFDGKEPVFKKMKTIKVENPETGEIEEIINRDDPFGALISASDGQRHYKDKNGVEQLSVINSIRNEGEWDEWSRTLPTQFLAKQGKELIKKQLDLTYADKKAEYDEILSLTNDQIKKKLLIDFSDGLDKAAVDLKTRSLPGQSVKVILPDPNIKDGEIYAPQYKDGEYLALVRFPHEGTFQIPILKVNNNIQSSKSMLGDGKDTAIDAVCINKKTADKMSGADFDGDTVTIIPTNGSNGIKISSKPSLKALENFDAKTEYAGYEGMTVIKKQNMQKQMGVISNLVTDMTLMGATDSELARATRYANTIIDSYKHKLDYKASYEDNGIAELQMKYQGKTGGGAATLFSRAKSQARINQVKEGVFEEDPITGKVKKITIDPNTGEKLYRETGKTSVRLPSSAKKLVDAIKKDPDMDAETKNSKIREIYAENGQDYNVQTVSTKMTEALKSPQGARKISSGTVKENMYADYADSLYSLANQARLKYLDTPDVKRDPKAAVDYAPEVESLKKKVSIALQNAPRERQAQLLANKRLESTLKKNPDLKDDSKELKKLKSTLIQKARVETGSDGKGSRVTLTDKEWDAIQHKAVSANLLKQILDHTDTDSIKERAMPRSNGNALPVSKQNQIKAWSASGYTSSQIAESLGISVSTVLKYLK